MNPHLSSLLSVDAHQTTRGMRILVNGKAFAIEYPTYAWASAPQHVRRVLVENVTYAETNWLPLILGGEGIQYHTAQPVFESLFFKNQLYDLLFTEQMDGASHLQYLRAFYNLQFEFLSPSASLPLAEKRPGKESSLARGKPTAIVPFTFGKESLATLGLCRELGIRPILLYCQEPVQPYEEKYKRAKLVTLKKKFGVLSYFIKHEPGLFRYGKAFGMPHANASELGWGAQVSLLILLAIPLAWTHRDARYILFGNEYSNNERKMQRGWYVYPSVDQTSLMTGAQDTMTRILTNSRCETKSSLEPLQEISIFYLLHHRYPELGAFQFSCSAEQPLYEGTQWCHRCYKCARMYLFARALAMDPVKLGFKKDLLENISIWAHYFGKEVQSGSVDELTFAFYILYRRRDRSSCTRTFAKTHLRRAKPWQWYKDSFCTIQKAHNLPFSYREKLHAIFEEELRSLRAILI